MEPTRTTACPQWAAPLMDWTDGAGTQAQRAQAAAHLQTCPACAQAAQEMFALRRALGALPARPLSPQFEAKLAARLADTNAQRARSPWRAAWVQAWQRGPRVMRPAFALGAACLAVAGAMMFGHPAPDALSTPPSAVALDHALVSHCVEQHRTEAAAQPLSDLSAQNLAAQVDNASPTDTYTNAASEDGL